MKIESFENLGRRYGLEVMQALLSQLDHPEKETAIIHVAGTNGKGSTVNYLASALIANGTDLMTFTSPQIKGYLDRFCFNGSAVSQKDFDSAEAVVLKAADALTREGLRHASVFEMELAVAFVLAKILGADVFLMETGLGGRLDATNAVENQMATVFTSISIDHKAELGASIREIAEEKSGIVKENVPVFSNVQMPEAAAVIAAKAAKQAAPIHFLAEEDIELVSSGLSEQRFLYHGDEYLIRMPGEQQIYNAALAVMVLENLPAAYRPSAEIIREALAGSRWYGSFELYARQPDIILDGAHNEDAARVLADNIRYYYPEVRRTGILHLFKDKDVPAILTEMQGVFDHLFLPDMGFPRSLDADELYLLCKRYLPETKCTVMEDLPLAITRAIAESEMSDLIVIFGSLSHLEAARQTLNKMNEVVIK